MRNYESYNVEDFLRDEGFRDWVQGNGNQEQFWMSFLKKYPEKKEMISQAEHFIRAVHVHSDRISEKEIRAEVQSFIKNAEGISVTGRAFDKPEKKLYLISKRAFSWMTSVAAGLLFLIAVNWFFSREEILKKAPVSDSKPGLNLVKTNNDTKKPLKILLGDGSEVILSPQSSLSYPSHFEGNSRNVYLTGEAVFSVRRQGQTFKVHTGNVVTKVLGTRFVVRAFEQDKKIMVQVQTGKVSVYVSKPEVENSIKEVNGLILNANQAAIFEKSISQLTKTLVSNPAKVTQEPLENIAKYDEVPLPVIFKDLESMYGIPVEFDTESFRGCKITATLSNESLYEKLDILCKTVSANYEILDGQIVITGKGCR